MSPLTAQDNNNTVDERNFLSSVAQKMEGLKLSIEKIISDLRIFSGEKRVVRLGSINFPQFTQMTENSNNIALITTTTTAGTVVAPENIFSFGTAEKTAQETEEIGNEVDKLLNTKREITFEEGLGTSFYNKLEFVVRRYGKDAILALYYRIIISKQHDPEVAAEILNRLGTIDGLDSDTHSLRLWLLEKALEHPSPWVREGATNGLSCLNDPKAILSLTTAAEKEHRRLLKGEMKKVIARLSRTRDAAVSKDHIQSR